MDGYRMSHERTRACIAAEENEARPFRGISKKLRNTERTDPNRTHETKQKLVNSMLAYMCY